MALTFPVSRSFSMLFQVVMCEWLWTISREPSGSLGKIGWFPWFLVIIGMIEMMRKHAHREGS